MQFVLQVKNEMGSGISQATGQIKGLGDAADQTQTKAKSSGMGVGQAFQFVALNAFNLASSLIQTKRSYEDLAKAENTQRGKRETVITTTNALKKAEINLALARQKGDPAKIAKAELSLENAKIKVGKATRAEQLGQVELNRAHEDFYLNIIPNVISGLGTIFGLFQVMQGVGGIKGLISGFGKLFLPLTIISGIFLAIKTNFLGFRDAVTGFGKNLGDQIPALRPFLNILQEIGELLGLLPAKKGTKAGGGLNKAIADLKAQFGPIIDFFKRVIDDVMKGDWSKVFQRISGAAAIAWQALKKAFPLLGDVESLVNKIMNGNWKGVFLQIWKAAVDVWNTIKTAVPFLGDIEAFITALAAHKWDAVFAAVMKGWQDSGLPTLIEKIFGVNWKSGLDAKIQQWIGQFGLFANSIKGQDWKGAFGAITQASKDSGFQALMDNLIKPSVGMGANFATALISGISDAIIEMTASAASTDVSASLTSFFNAVGSSINWVTIATNMMTTFFMAIGAYLITNFQGPLTQLFAATLKLAFSGQTAIATMTNAAIDLVNALTTQIMLGLKTFFEGKELWLPGAKAFMENFQAAMDKQKIPHVPVPTPPTQDELNKLAQQTMGGVQRGINGQPRPKVIVNVLASTSKFVAQMNNLMHNAPVGSRFRRFATGFHGMINQPTMAMIGENGPERVDVSPMGKSSGGGGTSTIIVYSVLDGQVIAESVAKRISVNQAVYR